MFVKSLKSLLKLFSWNCIIFQYSYWSLISVPFFRIVLFDKTIYITWYVTTWHLYVINWHLTPTCYYLTSICYHLTSAMLTLDSW